MDVIGDDIKKALKDAGYESEIDLILHPAWTTDWITPRGRKALEDYGIAAPLEAEADKDVLLNEKAISEMHELWFSKYKISKSIWFNSMQSTISV